MKKNVWMAVVVLVLVAGVGVWWLASSDADGRGVAAVRDGGRERPLPSAEEASAQKDVRMPPAGTKGNVALPSEEDDEDEPEIRTEEQKAAAAAEAKVDAFDNLTDKWMEPAKAGVTMKDVDGFVAAFRQVPKDRQDECIHRALNLVPDENVMLLAGVLMDKTMDKEIVETVFNDILNRDEDVKKPILQQIFKDKTHPCWADTAWILDVTGETPAKQTPVKLAP